MSNKIYVQLKDKNTTMWDPQQQVSIVADRIAHVYPNSQVISDGLRNGLLIKLDDADGAVKYRRQNDRLRKDGFLPPLEDDDETPTPPAKKKAQVDNDNDGDDDPPAPPKKTVPKK